MKKRKNATNLKMEIKLKVIELTVTSESLSQKGTKLAEKNLLIGRFFQNAVNYT